MQLLKNTKKPIETRPNKRSSFEGFLSSVKGCLRDTTGSIICFCFFIKKKKEGNVLFKDALTQHILFTVIWRHTYGKGPLRW